MLLLVSEQKEYTQRDRSSENIRQTHRKRGTHTHTQGIVPVQAMRSLSDYRRVIEW